MGILDHYVQDCQARTITSLIKEDLKMFVLFDENEEKFHIVQNGRILAKFNGIDFIVEELVDRRAIRFQEDLLAKKPCRHPLVTSIKPTLENGYSNMRCNDCKEMLILKSE